MIIGSSAIQHIVTKALAHTNVSPTDKDAFANAAALTSAIAPVSGDDDSSTQSSTGDQPGYDDAFAKMMVNLKAATASTTDAAVDPQAALASMMAGADKQVASTDSVASGASDSVDALSASASQDMPASVGSAKDEFMDYMSQSAAEKVRQQLTGVSKDEYAAMSPEEKAAVDKRVADLTREKAEVAQQEIKTKIAMAKAEMA
jgi:hypothetical protein